MHVFIIGLETIHQLTQSNDHELRIDLEDFNGETRFAQYRYFSIMLTSIHTNLCHKTVKIGTFLGSFR